MEQGGQRGPERDGDRRRERERNVIRVYMKSAIVATAIPGGQPRCTVVQPARDLSMLDFISKFDLITGLASTQVTRSSQPLIALSICKSLISGIRCLAMLQPNRSFTLSSQINRSSIELNNSSRFLPAIVQETRRITNTFAFSGDEICAEYKESEMAVIWGCSIDSWTRLNLHSRAKPPIRGPIQARSIRQQVEESVLSQPRGLKSQKADGGERE